MNLFSEKMLFRKFLAWKKLIPRSCQWKICSCISSERRILKRWFRRNAALSRDAATGFSGAFFERDLHAHGGALARFGFDGKCAVQSAHPLLDSEQAKPLAAF